MIHYPTFYELQQESYNCAKEKGWHDQGVDENPVIKLALTHGELSEALEEYRDGKMEVYYEGNKPEGFGIELADAVIRIMDMATMVGISDLSGLIQLKQSYNRTRPYRHGGKKI